MIWVEVFVVFFIGEFVVLDVRVLDCLFWWRFICWFDVYYGDEVSDFEFDLFRVFRGVFGWFFLK